MRRVILVVLDGLGVGALDDCAQTRPGDVGADSLAHALAVAPAPLPFLASLGLGNAAPSAPLDNAAAPRASWGQAELGYPGADSFLGHQVLMGGDVSAVRLETFALRLGEQRQLLRARGHDAFPLDGAPVLVVDGGMLVADSLEADPGMNYNVTGSLEAVTFEDVREVAAIVRQRAAVPRVIAVGARHTSIQDILNGVHERAGAVGIDTPGLGIYDRGAEIEHLGTPHLETDHQLPSLAAAAGLPVTLVGKMADIVACDDARRLPAVPTTEVLEHLEQAVDDQDRGLIGVNVQELDLAGHNESAAEYVAVLEASDAALAALSTRLDDGDLLLVVGDHGNDPTRGPMHTRERVPLLALAPALSPRPLGVRRTLADVGASACAWLGLAPPAIGTPCLEAGP